MKNLFIPLLTYLLSRRGEITGIAFIDSTSIDVCHNKRIRRNKVFKGLTKRGKTTAGWFYGFKLHLIINELGEILAFQLTPGNASDISVVEILSKGIVGKLFGDKGYISAELAKRVLKQGLELFTTLRSNMKQKFMKLNDKILLRKRAIIETVNDQLKNISQIEHTRHRSAGNFLILETAVRDDKEMQVFESESFADRGRHSLMVKAPPIRSDCGSKDCVSLSSRTAVSRLINLFAGIAAYTHQTKKPSINLGEQDRLMLKIV